MAAFKRRPPSARPTRQLERCADPKHFRRFQRAILQRMIVNQRIARKLSLASPETLTHFKS